MWMGSQGEVSQRAVRAIAGATKSANLAAVLRPDNVVAERSTHGANRSWRNTGLSRCDAGPDEFQSQSAAGRFRHTQRVVVASWTKTRCLSPPDTGVRLGLLACGARGADAIRFTGGSDARTPCRAHAVRPCESHGLDAARHGVGAVGGRCVSV